MLIAALVLMGVPALAVVGAWAFPRWRGRGFTPPEIVDHLAGSDWPRLSILLPVHNGAAYLDARIENLLATDYPSEQIELLVGCDGCTDETASRARAWANRDPRVRVIEQERQGKAATLNALAALASGEWLIFTDVAAHFERTTLSQLMLATRADARVGLVSGRWAGTPESALDLSAFERVEASNARALELMRAADARASGVLFAPWGPCYAQRLSDFRPIPAELLVDDTWVGLTHYQHGGLASLAWHAQFQWRFARREADQLQRRRRIAAGNLQLLLRLGHLLLTPRRSGLALWGQHGLRWLLPLWLLLGVQGYLLLAVAAPAAAVVVAMALCGALLLVPQLPYRLRQVWAQLLGWFDVLRGRTQAGWRPTVR